MGAIDLNKLKKDHARWESEHGHWLKDLEVWDARQQHAIEIFESLEKSLKSFSGQIEVHSSLIKNHKYIIKMHEDAISWQKEHPPKKVVEGEVDMHSFQQEIHSHEKERHEHLRKTHQEIVARIGELAESFNLTA